MFFDKTTFMQPLLLVIHTQFWLAGTRIYTVQILIRSIKFSRLSYGHTYGTTSLESYIRFCTYSSRYIDIPVISSVFHTRALCKAKRHQLGFSKTTRIKWFWDLNEAPYHMVVRYTSISKTTTRVWWFWK